MITLSTLAKIPSWLQWLLHSFLIWLIITTADAIDFLYRIHIYGPYLKHADGTEVTLWERFEKHNINQKFGVVVLVVILLTECNYHYFFTRVRLRVFLLTTLGTGLFSWIFVQIIQQRWSISELIAPDNLLPVLCIAAYVFGYAILRNFISERIRQLQKQYEQSQTELSALKAQLHPHFFFNTLNMIYGTAMQEEAVRTAGNIAQLSGLLRYVLNEHAEEFTPVATEFTFLEDYIELQKSRIPSRSNIHIHTQLDYDQLSVRIAPLLLLPFVENAFMYGISIDRDCYIKLLVSVKNKQLIMDIENSLLPVHAIEKGHGTGIKNVKKRLSLLYPSHQLTIQKQKDFYKVQLALNLS
ncbi:histidine kinase [Cytophagaceae bacterium DM2B3-1]|uniref:Histidine kinase n=1 Tax=Xanthocytophaga flava TaxID=3048013 RepID=A0ABT7CR54_9BACT|nr:histidine kinase [Xanthocytophaga flavus]MDJ1466883.1 histidine kinase [Xanthocytophaga flavus]MDJ1496225.1 histidine kinase [Xanthocytophaga flavus]